MLGKLPELFDRAFLIGYLLPALLFLAALGGLFGLSLDLGLIEAADAAKAASAPGAAERAPSAASATDVLAEAGIAVAVAWLLALALAALNTPLIRILEGYTPPLKWIGPLKRRQIRRWKRVYDRITGIEGIWDRHNRGDEVLPDEGKPVPDVCRPGPTIQELLRERDRLLQHIACRFPDAESLILPTALGNAMRALEVYPRVVYGLDGIPGWLRILGLMPKDMLTIVKDAKTHFDLAVNLVWLGLVLSVTAGIQTGLKPGWWPAAFAAGGFIVAVLAYFGAVAAAVQWGGVVKAGFDLLIPKLAAHLGFREPIDAAQRRAFWIAVSQSMIYRLPLIPPPGAAPIAPPVGGEDGGDKDD